MHKMTLQIYAEKSLSSERSKPLVKAIVPPFMCFLPFISSLVPWIKQKRDPCSLCTSVCTLSMYAYSFFIWCGSLISYAEEGLTVRCFISQLLFDTQKRLFSLMFAIIICPLLPKMLQDKQRNHMYMNRGTYLVSSLSCTSYLLWLHSMKQLPITASSKQLNTTRVAITEISPFTLERFFFTSRTSYNNERQSNHNHNSTQSQILNACKYKSTKMLLKVNGMRY